MGASSSAQEGIRALNERLIASNASCVRWHMSLDTRQRQLEDAIRTTPSHDRDARIGLALQLRDILRRKGSVVRVARRLALLSSNTQQMYYQADVEKTMAEFVQCAKVMEKGVGIPTLGNLAREFEETQDRLEFRTGMMDEALDSMGQLDADGDLRQEDVGKNLGVSDAELAALERLVNDVCLGEPARLDTGGGGDRGPDDVGQRGGAAGGRGGNGGGGGGGVEVGSYAAELAALPSVPRSVVAIPVPAPVRALAPAHPSPAAAAAAAAAPRVEFSVVSDILGGGGSGGGTRLTHV